MSPSGSARSTRPLPGKPVRCWIRTSRSVTSGAGWPRERNIYISMGKGIWSSGTKKCAGWFFVYSCVWTINQIELALESCCLAIGLVIKSYRISHRKSLFSHRISYSKKVPKECADNWRGQKYMIYTDIQLKEKIYANVRVVWKCSSFILRSENKQFI